MSKTKKRIEKLDSLIVAVILLADTITAILSNGFGVESGANLYVLIAAFSLVALKLVLEAASGIKGKWNFTFKSFFLLIAILTLYLITYMTCDGKQNYTFIQLIFYAIVPLIVIGLDIKAEYVLRYAVYISVLTIFALDGILAIRWEGYEQADLGSVYSLITMLICVMFHLRYYGKKSKPYIKLMYCYNLYVFIRVVMVANRGAILVLVIAVFVLFLHNFDKERITTTSTKRLITIVLISIVVIFVNENLSVILEEIVEFFQTRFGDVPSALSKMQQYINEKDITNGRNDINMVLFNAFRESPIYGHGLNMFEDYTMGEYPYPHNYIFQYIFEGGILFAFFPVFFSVGAVFKVITGAIKEQEKYIIAAVLVCQCFPKLLLSTNVWFGTAIWMLIVYSANNLFLWRNELD